MAKSVKNIKNYSRFNLSETESDITVFVKEYRKKVLFQIKVEDENYATPFPSFATKKPSTCDFRWVGENANTFITGTPNQILEEVDYMSQLGFITCMTYTPDGEYIIVGHSTGLMQMRHGTSGVVACTLRNIQFPPKPIYAIECSKTEEKICYAASMDGNIYRIEIPSVALIAQPSSPEFCIKADPALESLTMQFYGAPGLVSYASPFISHRSAALSFGVTADNGKIVVGYADTSIKVYDMATAEAELTYKVHKLRLPFIPKKLRRIHFGQIVALRCHKEKPNIFASAAWDKTLRIWDVRCKVGCVMTFEGVDVCSDSVDLCREVCVAGSWQPTEALTVWDLAAKKRQAIIRVQNRRPDVDGEYIYACRFWNSSLYNRKGKYVIIGGSGTNCVEVINIHNRYISCSYPADGTITAVTSYEERIAYGGTTPILNIVTFHDPKHEKYEKEDEVLSNYVYTPPSYNESVADSKSLNPIPKNASKFSVA